MKLRHIVIAAMAGGALSTAGAAGLTANDKAFITKAAQGGMTEVQASQLAETQSSDPKVKAFAARMVEDHSKANQELISIVSAKGGTLPPSVSEEQAKLLGLLKTSSGKDFDKLYADKVGVKAHEETVNLLVKESRSGDDADLKAFATRTLTPVRMHLDMAKDLNRAVH
ncbi:DUF4142 domain-containing protein [Uliginosibacterium sp. sgz301328]|uniref:DUF4142 domain-containing protein n=1 Tax=Uliginosibacterium sp. sgz301328 TaxID=3243764 RepID=UPI00359F0141